MTRDLANYEQQYHTLPFEETQVRYRKRKILESRAKYRPQTVLEFGCGVDPIFNPYPNVAECVIVEPAEAFYQNAVVQSIGRPHISVVQGTLELSLIHISEPTRQAEISYAVFCLKKKKNK